MTQSHDRRGDSHLAILLGCLSTIGGPQRHVQNGMMIQKGSCATHATNLKQTFASIQLSIFLCVADKLLHNPAVMNIDIYEMNRQHITLSLACITAACAGDVPRLCSTVVLQCARRLHIIQ